MFCSAIIPSIGRQTLERSVISVLEQDFSESTFEVIVINDSGQPLAPAAWQNSELVQILNTNKLDKSIARNTGASIAKGEYLHFLDDDDWMLPGAYSSFWRVANEFRDAVLLYGSSHMMDRNGVHLYQMQHTWISNNNWLIPLLSGEWMATEAYMIKTQTFFETGGANPNMPTFEERDVCRRVALRGNFAGTSDVVSCHYIGEENSTTDFSRGNLDNYLSRETVLNEPDVLRKMVSSVQDGSWHGRILRVYAASTSWNIKQKKLFTAASRFSHGLLSLIFAGANLFMRSYWRSFANPYSNKSFIYPENPNYVPIEEKRNG